MLIKTITSTKINTNPNTNMFKVGSMGTDTRVM
jgi:hypothetical protein